MERLGPSFKNVACRVLLAGGILLTGTACQSSLSVERDRAYAKKVGIHYVEKNGFLILAIDRETLDARVYRGEDFSDPLLNQMRVENFVNQRCEVRNLRWIDNFRAGIIVKDSSCIDQD